MNEPTIRQIRYFIAVANMGQISRAAMELNVSQSAVTTAVKQLEEIVGAPLLNRHAGGVALTYEGNIFLDHARRDRLYAVDDPPEIDVHDPLPVRGRLLQRSDDGLGNAGKLNLDAGIA